MLIVGLTGNVAAGKSTVAEVFRRGGAVVVDADELAREAVAPGSSGLDEVAMRVGPEVLAPDGSLDRAAMRRLMLEDPEVRETLEAIIHPEVSRGFLRVMRDATRAGTRILVYDVPLLFEKLDPSGFDVIILVDAPAEVRKARLMSARGLDPADADALIAAQMPAADKRPRSHLVIDNVGTTAELEARAAEVWRELQERAGAV